MHLAQVTKLEKRLSSSLPCCRQFKVKNIISVTFFLFSSGYISIPANIVVGFFIIFFVEVVWGLLGDSFA